MAFGRPNIFKSFAYACILFLTACVSMDLSSLSSSPAPIAPHSARVPAVPAAQFSESGLPLPVRKPDLESDYDYYRIANPVQCVPYARKISGIQIRGDAHTWLQQANYKDEYTHGKKPKVGAVIVLSKTGKLKYGHVAVVKRIVDNRNIEVAHSNWGYNKDTRCMIYKRMPVRDISVNNDWSKVRFWDYPSKSYGSAYPVSGFVYKTGAPMSLASNREN